MFKILITTMWVTPNEAHSSMNTNVVAFGTKEEALEAAKAIRDERYEGREFNDTTRSVICLFEQ